MTKKIAEFKYYIESASFYDAHETLEAIWFPRRFESSNEVKLLKGFINAAVSFELLKRGRVKQSQKVWANYLKYRQLLFKTESLYLNDFYKLARYIENIHTSNSLKSHSISL